MKNTGKNRKIVTTAIAALSCLVVAGVGYGTWVIAGSVTEKTGNIDIITAPVEDQRATLTAVVNTGNASVAFGPTSGASEGPIKDGSDNDTEDLTAQIDVTFVVNTANTNTYSFGISLTDSATEAGSAISAITGDSHDYISLPANDSELFTIDPDGTPAYTGSAEISETTKAGYSLTETDSTTDAGVTTYTITLTVTFGWGSYFNYKNPTAAELSTQSGYNDGTYVTYDSDQTQIAVDNVVAALNAIETALTDIDFVFTLTPTTTSADA